MAEEKKPASKQSKKAAAPKKEAPKPIQEKKPAAPKKEATKSTTIEVGATVVTPSGKICKVLSIEENLCRLQRIDNQKLMFLSKSKLSLKK